MLSGWLCGVVGQVDELVGKVAVEIVDDRVAAAPRARHVDDEVGAHRRPEHQPIAVERMRVAGLSVIGDHDRLVPLEPKPDDPGERRVDDAQPDPLPGLHGYAVGNPAIDRDGVADAARHAGFHAVAEAGGDPSVRRRAANPR